MMESREKKLYYSIIILSCIRTYINFNFSFLILSIHSFLNNINYNIKYNLKYARYALFEYKVIR